MVNRDKPYVFISYASVDRARVLEVAADLDAIGVEYWLDQADIPGGMSYGPEIVDGIKNAAALVLMCSAASLASRNVKQEIQLAWKHDRPILPLMLEQMFFPDDVSYWLEGAQWIEVLNKPASDWIESFRRALALTGYRLPDRQETPSEQEERVSADLPPNNLPIRSSRLIGRERELRQTLALLQNTRLLTLTGPGGTGKTRLAEETARAAAPLFDDGIWFVDGSVSTSADALLEAVASTLNITESGDGTLAEAIAGRLQGSQTLLLLDNLEQIPDANEAVRSLLIVDGTKIVATSRRTLSETGEIAFPVAPLLPPDATKSSSASELAANPAVALFVERARDARPEFILTDGNAADVADICAKLDGLPLAIELAAARIRMMNPGALLERLDSRLALLTRGLGKDPRQQTLRAAIEWSYDLLDPVEQTIFRGLGVFAGGMTVSSAEAVISSSHEDIDALAVLDSLESLVDHNLLQIDTRQATGDDQRLRMLETIREFAGDQLAFHEETAVLTMQHARHFLEVSRTSEPELTGGRQVEALARLESDHDNLRSAITYLTEIAATDRAAAELSLQMAAALWRFWWSKGYYSEGNRLIEAALSRGANVHGLEKAKALNAAGVMAFSIGDLDRARKLHEAARAICSSCKEDAELAISLDNLGIVNIVSGKIDAGIEMFIEAMNSYQAAGDKRGEAVVLEHLAGAYHAADQLDLSLNYGLRSLEAYRNLGDPRLISFALEQVGITKMYLGLYDESIIHLQEALAMTETLDNPGSLGNVLLNLASSLELSGSRSEATASLERAIPLLEEAGNDLTAGYATYLLGHVERQLGELDSAEAHVRAALVVVEASGQIDAVALCHEALAGISVDRGDFPNAADHFGIARGLRETNQLPVPQTRVPIIRSDVDRIESAIGSSQISGTPSAFWPFD